MRDKDIEELDVAEKRMGRRRRGGEGGLQVRAWSWNTLSSAEVQNGTLLTRTVRTIQALCPMLASLSLSVCVCV